SLRHPREEVDDAAFLLTTLGRLWLAGVEVDWPALHGEKRRRLVLPTYPFERRRCWIEPQVGRAQGTPVTETETETKTKTKTKMEMEMEMEMETELPAGLAAAVDHLRPDLQVAYLAPRDGLERRIAEVWSHHLGIAEIGVHDNFFELGGHSVLATQVVARLRRDLRTDLPLATLFAHPTVAGLAAELPEEVAAGPGDEAISIPRRPRRGEVNEFPLSFSQQRFWFLDQLEPGNPAYHFRLVLRFAGALRVGVLSRVLDELVRRHETLRTTFPEVDGEPMQVVGPPRRREPPVVDLRQLTTGGREAAADRLIRAEGLLAFDLARGPLLRLSLLRLGEEEHLVLVNMHHIVSDGWSISVFVRELTALYEAFSQGKPSPLPELPIQYADFASWQREWLQ
ncbi:MAG: non-ribosomal peptide synthetase, partial [bacterium]|nr:non-ribosomal peptide synthetase [bacterium]